MNIRPARESDFSAIAAITNTSIINCAIHFGYEPVTPAELAEVWRVSIGRYPWFVAELDPANPIVAGYAKASLWRERAAYAWTVETAVYVDATAHRRGVGRALYARLLDELTQQGFHTAVAGITLPNAASVGLHESMGFTYVGRFAQVGWKLEAWHDVGFWQYPLAPAQQPAKRLTAPADRNT